MSFVKNESSEFGEGEGQNKHATVILMGRRRSGKSSIIELVFNKMKPSETAFLESTARPEILNVASLIDISLMELPGQIDYFTSQYDPKKVFQDVGAIVYVIDAQDDYYVGVNTLTLVISKAFEINKNIRFEVLIHKIDGLSEEFRDDTVRDIRDRVSENLFEIGLENFQNIDYYQTSIYDQSIYEVLSKIISKLVAEQSDLELLLDTFVQHCHVEKAFLCDLRSKLYFVTDSSPLDSKIYEVCAEFLDLAMDLNTLICPSKVEDFTNSSFLESDYEDYYEDNVDKSEDSESKKRLRCVSKLTSGIKLYLHEMINNICLIAFIRDDSGDDDSAANAVLDYNAAILRKGLVRIFEQ